MNIFLWSWGIINSSASFPCFFDNLIKKCLRMLLFYIFPSSSSSKSSFKTVGSSSFCLSIDWLRIDFLQYSTTPLYSSCFFSWRSKSTIYKISLKVVYEQYPLLMIAVSPLMVASFISLRSPTKPAQTVSTKLSSSPISSMESVNSPTNRKAYCLAPLFCSRRDSKI